MDVTTTELAIGMFVAFGAAVFAVGVDLQQTIKTQLGKKADTSVLAVREGWMILLGWGVVVALMYLYVLHHKEWAKTAFGLDVGRDSLLAGLAVGLSAVLIIRSKLAKVGTFEIGGELAYLWSRAYVVKAVNQVRMQKRDSAVNRYQSVVDDIAGNPELFSKLEEWMIEAAKPMDDIAPAMKEQIDTLKNGAVNGQPDKDPKARKYLVRVALDYFSVSGLDSFAKANGIKPTP